MRVGFGSITKEKGGEIQPEFQPVSDALTNSATPWRCGIGTEDGWSYIAGSLSRLVSTLQDKYQSTFCCNHQIGL